MKYLKIALLIIYQPQTAFDQIKKNREMTPAIVPLLLYLMVLAVKTAEIWLTHFPLSENAIENTNIVETLTTIVIPLMSLVGGIYLVTAIRDGETSFYETYTAVAYCLIPYILLTIPIALFSHVLTSGEQGLYTVLKAAVLIWCGLLVVYGIGHLNSYSFTQTVWNSLLALFAVLFIWAVLILLYILGEKLFGFIKEVITEYSLLKARP